jgi:cytosine/adenosine deaminase-related metal-dependent hydrolase
MTTKSAVRGRVVCMDPARTVLADGTVYMEKGAIVAVQPATVAPPAGFAQVQPLQTSGTVYPGLIDLHNHVSYNVLPLWPVPKEYSNRDQWAGTKEYRQLVTMPMEAIGSDPDLTAALVRYVECKCLLGGVTTTQGFKLFSNSGITHYYRGLVRNVESTGHKDLKNATCRIADVEAKERDKFAARLAKSSCLLLHLSEGDDAAARKHFQALQGADGTWAVAPPLAGIHCAALTPPDFQVLGGAGAAMVWSPLSNRLLYGATADVAAAKRSGVRIALGPDWSPTGSKNLLGELKAAHAWNAGQSPPVFTDEELVAMVTCQPAAILGWRPLGSLAAGKRADLIVVAGKQGDPYTHLVASAETDLRLVVVNGTPRYGTPALMQAWPGEALKVGGQARVLNLQQADADPVVGKVTLAQATQLLCDALAQPGSPHALPRGMAGAKGGRKAWTLALDETRHNEVSLRPRLPDKAGRPTGPDPVPAALLAKGPVAAVPIRLDPLTVADDPGFLPALKAERNLPAGLADRIAALY